MASTNVTLTDEEVNYLKITLRPMVVASVEEYISEGFTFDEAWSFMVLSKPEEVTDQQAQLMEELFREVWAETEA
jgi:hypothetical protein